MNYRTTLLILAVTIGSIGVANGQFLEKLAKKAEKAAERTVERRVEREAEKKTDKALDKVFEESDRKGTKNNGVESSALAAMLGGGSMEDVPDTYTFSYRATMKIIHDDAEEEAAMQYWLEPGATYFGTKALMEGAGNHIAVMDAENKAMVMFMDDGERKTAMRLSGSQNMMDKYFKIAVANEAGEPINVTSIASKTILGYHCKGFQMETEDGISKVWVTDEAPVGMLAGMFQPDNVPQGMPDFGDQALFMEMEYVPKDEDHDHFRMVCTELKPASMAIHKKEYQGLYPPRDIN